MSDFGIVPEDRELCMYLLLIGVIFRIISVLMLPTQNRLIRLVNLSFLVGMIVAALVLDAMWSPGNAEGPVQGPQSRPEKSQ